MKIEPIGEFTNGSQAPGEPDQNVYRRGFRLDEDACNALAEGGILWLSLWGGRLPYMLEIQAAPTSHDPTVCNAWNGYQADDLPVCPDWPHTIEDRR